MELAGEALELYAGRMERRTPSGSFGRGRLGPCLPGARDGTEGLLGRPVDPAQVCQGPAAAVRRGGPRTTRTLGDRHRQGRMIGVARRRSRGWECSARGVGGCQAAASAGGGHYELGSEERTATARHRVHVPTTAASQRRSWPGATRTATVPETSSSRTCSCASYAGAPRRAGLWRRHRCVEYRS